MPNATAWRRRGNSDASALVGSDVASGSIRRRTSPTRPRATSIERLSPPLLEPTTPRQQSSATRPPADSQLTPRSELQGLGLSNTPLTTVTRLDADHLYLDDDGRAHLGTKPKSPKREPDLLKPTARRSNARSSSTTQYRGPPKRGHTRTGSTIDDLATVAIATSPHFNANPSAAFVFGGSPVLHSPSRPNTSYINGYSQDAFDRPAKRIKSERLHSVEWSQDERPKSSYTLQSQVSTEDAELLLGLASGFRFVPATKSEGSNLKVEDSPAPLTRPIFDNPFVDASPAPKDKHVNPRARLDPLTHAESRPEEQSNSHENMQLSEDDPDLTLPEESERRDLEHALVATDRASVSGRPPPIQAATGTAESQAPPPAQKSLPTSESRKQKRGTVQVQPVCPACKKIQYGGREGESTINWINCEGPCNAWFHIPCAGFLDSEVKKIAKFICPTCEPEHGKTVFARTSTRARAAPDYAALNEGVTKTSEDNTMHHFVTKFKDGSLKYHQDNFARIRPEILTKDLWANFDGMKRPLVVPACWNPRYGENSDDTEMSDAVDTHPEPVRIVTGKGQVLSDLVKFDYDYDQDIVQDEVVDLDQDYLDMVMPRNLTVRKVAELYGPEEPVPVIDVKTQLTRGKFTLRQWANYYEEKGNKPIRNVISLEVSLSRLGRLIRRPRVVRDIDLEPQVWDSATRAISKTRPIAFYCLMSVADSYTDFHIDFGGSSVYYHILEGQKTFFFIPPEERYLKKYEEWNNSPEQGNTWLPDLCGGNVTRVDLFPGDTAFIPAGWIHSVWTPCDSLVIGGNFLTRYDLDVQIKVAAIEKATEVPSTFRYPFFQKVMWYTLIDYLEHDPPPESVIQDFLADPEYRYLRAVPVWQEDEVQDFEEEPDEGAYNARRYTKSELRGLPALREYLYRTALIYADLPVENINKKQIDKVKASVPKGHGDPLQLVCEFAVWIAWKRGNELLPEWMHTDFHHDPERRDKDKIKKAEVFRVPPERVSTRRKAQGSPAPLGTERQATPETRDSNSPSDTPKLHYPRIACAHCRKRRIKCMHAPGQKVDEPVLPQQQQQRQPSPPQQSQAPQQNLEKPRSYSNVTIDIVKLAKASPSATSAPSSSSSSSLPTVPVQVASGSTTAIAEDNSQEPVVSTDLAQAALARMNSQPPESNGMAMNGTVSMQSGPISASANSSSSLSKKGRSKACDECRKSKRRCVHDEYGRVDPAKAAEPSKPRGSHSGKRPARLSDDHHVKRVKSEHSLDHEYSVFASQPDIDAMIDPALMDSVDPTIDMHFQNSGMNPVTNPYPTQLHPVFPDESPANTSAIDPNLDPSLMATSPTAFVAAEGSTSTGPEMLNSVNPVMRATPDLDKTYSPITTDSLDTNIKADDTDTTGSTTRQTAIEEESIARNTTPPEQSSSSAPPQDKHRPPSTATATSPPDEELMTPSSRRSSSHTSHTTTQQDVVTGHHEEVQQQVPRSAVLLTSPKTNTSAHDSGGSSTIQVKSEVHTASPRGKFVRANTASSNASVLEEDASEALARELQAQEHGLRRRPSVRIS